MGAFVLLALLLSAPSDDLGRAQRDVESELAKIVKPAPAELVVVFEGPDSGRWALGEGTFSLDGQELPFAPQGRRSTVYQAAVAPGRHAVALKLAYDERQGFGLFTYADTKYHVDKKLEVRTERGLRVKLVLAVDVDEKADAKSRLRLRATPLAELIDRGGNGGRDDDGKAELAWKPPPAPAASRPAALAAASPVPPRTAPLPEPVTPEPRLVEADPTGRRRAAPRPRHRRIVRELLALRAEEPAPPATPPAAAAAVPPTSPIPAAPSPAPAPVRPLLAQPPLPSPAPVAPSPLGSAAVPIALGLGALALLLFFSLRRRS